LREKILSKRQPSGADAIVAHEQPSGEALIDSVKTVAGGNLHQLDSGDLGETAELAGQLGASREDTSQDGGIETERGGVCLGDCAGRATTKSGDYSEANEAFLSDQADFNASAVTHHTEYGSEAGIEEIDGFDGLTSFVKQLATFDLLELQLGEQ
jgi:hypothetical protein